MSKRANKKTKGLDSEVEIPLNKVETSKRKDLKKKGKGDYSDDEDINSTIKNDEKLDIGLQKSM